MRTVWAHAKVQDIILTLKDITHFTDCMHGIIPAGHLEGVMLSGDNEGLQTQGSLPQFSFQSSQLRLLLLTASL